MRKMKEEFLYKLELFYRNFGSDWSIEDFSSDRNVQEFLKNYLLVLEEKGIVEIIENNKFAIEYNAVNLIMKQIRMGI